ncbi:MAG TPA: hypothetical protein VK508_10330 [Cyclobacteriaceae bacterium]|nr:hypothetical protein [Cyclobacteriaceae bacterium]
MKHTLLILLFATSIAYAQSTVENFRDVAGQPFFPKQYVDVNGTPYLFEDWTNSTITMKNGQALKGVRTNFNLVTNELLFLDAEGQAMVANPIVIKSVEVESPSQRKFVPTAAKNTFYEVISSEGKATLVKYSRKVIMETKPYNSATIQKNFVTDVSHMIVVDGKVTEVRSANDIYEALGSESLKEFAKKERLKQKSVESWIKIVNYYNSN